MAGIHYDEINDTVLWQGNALEEVQEYTFATVDHWVFIPFFPTLEIAGKIEFLFPEFIHLFWIHDIIIKHDYFYVILYII